MWRSGNKEEIIGKFGAKYISSSRRKIMVSKNSWHIDKKKHNTVDNSAWDGTPI